MLASFFNLQIKPSCNLPLEKGFICDAFEADSTLSFEFACRGICSLRSGSCQQTVSV
jgi:hypothetical protein